MPYTESDSPVGRTGAKCDVYYFLGLRCTMKVKSR